MPCYDPLHARLLTSAEGRFISFQRTSQGKPLSLPCGNCIGCKLERARQWAVRIMHEAKMHASNSFITLTYDDEHLPKDRSLSVDVVQKFVKRLRERIGRFCKRCGKMRRTCECPEFQLYKIRFFLCGEYGDKLGRPHYHAIIFGHDFGGDRVRLASGPSSQFELFESKTLSEAWGNGFVSIGQVSFDSACYVANYATKKIRTNKEDESKRLQGRTPEFLLMSRRPGIGRAWVDKFEGDVYPSDEVIVKGSPQRPPRYYDSIIIERAKTEFPPGLWTGLLAMLREKREAQASKLEETVYHGRKYLAKPSNNARRLEVRRAVAEAKAQLKSRRLQ